MEWGTVPESHLSVYTVISKAIDSVILCPVHRDEVSINADITNISDKPVVYTAALWLSGKVEEAESLLVAPGETTTASFKVVKYSYGSHQVRIDRLMGSFEVTEMEEEAVAVAWRLILGIVGGVVVVGLVVFLVTRRKFGVAGKRA